RRPGPAPGAVRAGGDVSTQSLAESPAPRVQLLLTEAAAAKALSISPRTLWGLRDAGEIPAVRIGRSVRYAVKDLEAWIERRRVSAGPKADEPGEGASRS